MSKYPVQPHFGYKTGELRPYSKDRAKYQPIFKDYRQKTGFIIVEKPMPKMTSPPKGLAKWGETFIVKVIPWKRY